MTIITINKIQKKIIIFTLIIFLAIFSLTIAQLAFAAATDAEVGTTFWGGKQSNFETGLGKAATDETKDPRVIAANVIEAILGFLGILATAFILWGGFKWMTARGNEEQVAEARKLIVSAVVGLVIILSAYALTEFVLNKIYKATT